MTTATKAPETFIRKGRDGWTAGTKVPFDTLPNGKERVINLATSKSGGHLITSASVATLDGQFEQHMLHADFYVRLMVAQKRCTDKNVEAQHALYLDKIEEIKELAREHYAKKKAD